MSHKLRLRADLILTSAGQDVVVGTPKILRGNKLWKSLCSISSQENLRQKMGKLNISIYKVFGGGFWGVVLFFVGVLLIICETGVEHNRIFKHVQQNFKT